MSEDDTEYEGLQDDTDYGGVLERLDELEAKVEGLNSGSGTDQGVSLGYALGTAIAVVLSWSSNGSILWCMLHGVLSWGYVIYFAATRAR